MTNVVTNRSMAHLVAPKRIFRLLVKGKFDLIYCNPFGETLIFALVARSTVRNSTVSI